MNTNQTLKKVNTILGIKVKIKKIKLQHLLKLIKKETDGLHK